MRVVPRTGVVMIVVMVMTMVMMTIVDMCHPKWPSAAATTANDEINGINNHTLRDQHHHHRRM